MKTIRNILLIAVLAFSLTSIVNAKETEYKVASSHENIEETTLGLENWMLEENFWNTSEAALYALETEKAMDLECWMLDDSKWDTDIESDLDEETELELESWMYNANYWETENSH